MDSPKSGSSSPKLVVKHTFLEVDEEETHVSHEKRRSSCSDIGHFQDMQSNGKASNSSNNHEEHKEPSSPALSGTSSSLAWRNRQEDNPVRLVVKHTFIEVDGQAVPKDPSIRQRRSSCSDIGANNALRCMADQPPAWNGIQEDSEDDEDQVGPKESMRSWTTATAFDSQSNFGEPGSNYGEYRDLRYSGSRRSSRTDFVPSLSPINCSNPENPGLPRKVELTTISAGLDLSPMSGKSGSNRQFPLSGSPVVGSPVTGSPIAGASFGFGAQPFGCGCNDAGSVRYPSEGGSQLMSPQQSGGATLEDISTQPSRGCDSSRTNGTTAPSGRSSRRNSGKMNVASFQNQEPQPSSMPPMMPGCGGCCCCCGGYAGPYACAGGMSPQSSYHAPCDTSGAFAYQPVDARSYPNSPTRYSGGAGDRDPRVREMPPPMMYPPVATSYPNMSAPGPLPPPHPYAMPPPGYMGGAAPPTLGTWPQGPMPPHPYMQNPYGPPAGPHGMPDVARHNPLALRPNNGSPVSRDAYMDPRGTVPTPCGSGSIPPARGNNNNNNNSNSNNYGNLSGKNGNYYGSQEGSPVGSSPAASASPTTGEQPSQIAPELRTTVMLRNIPEGYLRENLAKLLDAFGFQKQYDFLYLPMNFRTAAPIGYAFVNFVAPRHAQRCFEAFEGFCDWGVSTTKICEPAWSEGSQGLPEHIDRYRNCPLMHESVPDQYKPAVYSNGTRVPFPEPTQQVRRPRLRRVEGEEGNAQAA